MMRSPLSFIFLFCLLPFASCLLSDGRAGVVRAELGGVALGEHVDELVVEVVVAARHFGAHALVVHLARAVYVLAQTFVEVCRVAPVVNLLLVVELYLAYDPARAAAARRTKVRAAARTLKAALRRFRVGTQARLPPAVPRLLPFAARVLLPRAARAKGRARVRWSARGARPGVRPTSPRRA